MSNLRDRNNYPDIIIAPYQDPKTKAVYMEAVYTNGMFSVCSRDKVLHYEVDVYASMEAFEAGGDKIATPIVRTISTLDKPTYRDSGTVIQDLDYDSVIMGNAQTVVGVLQILSGIEAQFRGA